METKRIAFLALTTSMLFIFIFAFPLIAGTLREDFEDGKLEGWRQESPDDKKPSFWKIVKGELECTRHDRISTILITGDITWKDYTIEYDVKLLEDFGPGDVDVILRNITFLSGPTLLFGIGDFLGKGPEVFVQAMPGNPQGTGKPFDPLKLNEWHHFKGEAKGNQFTFWVNGEKVLDYVDEVKGLTTGAVGIGLANHKARFDNVVIIGPDVPDVKPKTWKTLPVESKGKLATTWGSLKIFR